MTLTKKVAFTLPDSSDLTEEDRTSLLTKMNTLLADRLPSAVLTTEGNVLLAEFSFPKIDVGSFQQALNVAELTRTQLEADLRAFVNVKRNERLVNETTMPVYISPQEETFIMTEELLLSREPPVYQVDPDGLTRVPDQE